MVETRNGAYAVSFSRRAPEHFPMLQCRVLGGTSAIRGAATGKIEPERALVGDRAQSAARGIPFRGQDQGKQKNFPRDPIPSNRIALSHRARLVKKRSTNVPGGRHRPGQGRLLQVGWARGSRAARACQKSAKILRHRGNIRRNQPRDVTESKTSDQQANSQESA
jgi:hypothetical protein